jgi:hypothetical protein
MVAVSVHAQDLVREHLGGRGIEVDAGAFALHDLVTVLRLGRFVDLELDALVRLLGADPDRPQLAQIE